MPAAVAAAQAQAQAAGVTLHLMSALAAAGAARPMAPLPHDPSDVATIMYTSGSTGRPKGVVMSYHKWNRTVGAKYSPTTPYVICSFQPLAHAGERVLYLVRSALAHTLSCWGRAIYPACVPARPPRGSLDCHDGTRLYRLLLVRAPLPRVFGWRVDKSAPVPTRGSMDTIFEDMAACRPTFVSGPPRFYNMLHGEFQRELAARTTPTMTHAEREAR